jgi:hypothetical protein
MVERWREEEAEAYRNRDEDEKSMDIFDIKACKGIVNFMTIGKVVSSFISTPAPTKAEFELNLLTEERNSDGRKGSTSLLAQGLKIEEMQ